MLQKTIKTIKCSYENRAEFVGALGANAPRETEVGASHPEEFGLYTKFADTFRRPGLSFNIVSRVLNCRLLRTSFVPFRPTLKNRPPTTRDHCPCESVFRF